MEANQLGERIAALRKERGLSQEKVAEYMSVSRQAVTKWESNNSRPSSDNLIKLAELFGVSVDTLLGNETGIKNETGNVTENEAEKSKTDVSVKMDKTPWICAGFSVVCIIAYMVVSGLLHIFSFGTLVCMFVICFPTQMFLHIYLANAVNKDSFSGLAGFNEKIQYNYVELKKMILQIDLHLGMTSSVYIFLLCVVNCADLNLGWLNGALIMLYVLDFTLIILMNNYKSINKIYSDENDKKRAIKSIPVTIAYIVMIFIGIGITALIFEIKGIENNTAPAMKLAGCLIGGILAATIGFLVENNNINKWSQDKSRYKISKVGLASLLVCVMVYVGMFFII